MKTLPFTPFVSNKVTYKNCKFVISPISNGYQLTFLDNIMIDYNTDKLKKFIFNNYVRCNNYAEKCIENYIESRMTFAGLDY